MKLVFKEVLQCNTVHSFLCRLWILEINTRLSYKLCHYKSTSLSGLLVTWRNRSLIIRDELSFLTVAGNGRRLSRIMVVVENKNHEKCASSFRFATVSHLVFTCGEVKTGVMLLSGMQSWRPNMFDFSISYVKACFVERYYIGTSTCLFATMDARVVAPSIVYLITTWCMWRPF